jgi:PAS domain S-box-containing protein
LTTEHETIVALRQELDRARAEAEESRRQGAQALAEALGQTEELRRSEERMRLMIEAVTDYAIILLDASGKISSWNRGAERIKGYSEAEILGKPYETFFLPDDAAAGKAHRLLSRAARDGHVEDEGWRRRKDGTRFWADAVITALFDPTGELLGYAKITRDLTDRRHAEAMASQNAQLAEANRMKSKFLANMSHELRTPLNSIIGYTDLVLTDKAEPLGNTGRRNLETVLRNARHLLGLINDVLDISKIEAGKMSVHAETFDLKAVLDSLLTSTEPLLHGRPVQLVLETHPDIGQVHTDETKLRQIVLNLLSNAIKFTTEGRITLSARPHDHDRFLIEVRDTGIGIAKEHQALVFEEFHQVDSSTTRAVGGTGLGLAISRKLAQLLGGKLTLESEPDVGSTFTACIPTRYAEGGYT